jgi:VCBS repeat protein
MRSQAPIERRAWPARGLPGVVLALAGHLALVARLRPEAVDYDGLANWMGARDGVNDYGHALYRPLLGLAQRVGAAETLAGARFLSALGAVLACGLLWRRIERAGAPRLAAGLATACFGLSTLFWQEAGSLEPTSWTVAALLGTAAAVEAWVRAPGAARAALCVGLFGAALGFHLVSVLALPWLVALARPHGARLLRSLFLGGLVLGAGGLALGLAGGELRAHLVYWWGFVPDFEGGAAKALLAHARRGGRLVLEGAPVLAGAALVALLVAGRGARAGTEPRSAGSSGAPELWLGGAYLAAFLVLGKPLVGLCVPVLLALALVLGRVLARVPEAHARRATLAVGLAAALQLGLSLPQALVWRRTPDPAWRRAELLARALPEGTRLFAGGLVEHLRFAWPELDVLSLPVLWHREHANRRDADPIAVVAEAVAGAGKPCALSSDGVAFLLSLGADPARLGIALERARLFPEDPRLALFPLGEAAAGAHGDGYDAPVLAPPPQAGAEAPPVPALELVLERTPFDSQGRNDAKMGDAFTLLLVDGDGDRDPDVLVNWHVFAPPALWWNEGGSFVRKPEGRAWSLPDHASVPLLEGPRKAMLEALARDPRRGVHVWHSDTGAFWFFAPAGELPPGATLRVETNRPILKVTGLEPEEFTLRDERFLEVPLVPALAGKSFFLATKEAAIQLKARVDGVPEGSAPPFFVGADATELAGPLDLWYRDPHGIAWLDVAGGALPEVYVTRGALRGQLGPPFDPKHDDFFLAGAEPGAFARVEVPGDYGRGRAVQWVDVDADGVLELHVTAKESPNRLLVFDAEHRTARDVAPERGLDSLSADACAWLDLDGDGDEDLVTLAARTGMGCLRNERGRFARDDALAPGLRLAPLVDVNPPGNPAADETTPGIDEHDLVLLDLENDGDVDVLVTGWGPTGACPFFRAEATGFVEATTAVGLSAATGTSQAVVADLDADGFLDVLCLGAEPRLFRNARGRLQPQALPDEWRAHGLRVGAPGDVDGDGRVDLVLAGRELWLARNRGGRSGSWVELAVARAGRIPVGARVRAVHADGSVHAARVGSTNRGHLSQGSGPLWLASPPENPLRRIEVLFPGGARRAVEVGAPGKLSVSVD